jgi:hypothetical protein
VSEYQHYEFLAVDAPLDAKAQAAVRALSTRARITPTSFVNTYQWGDFHGDPRALVERYYDAFLYTANWGTHRFMLRLPAKVLDPSVARRYCCTLSAETWTTGRHVMIDLTYSADERDGGWEDWDDEQDTLGDGWLASLIPARADLAAGDHRLLYLAWLHAVSGDAHDLDVIEPPVPSGLGSLPASLRRLVDFLHIDSDLLAAAAQTSPDLAPAGSSRKAWRVGLAKMPVRDKDALLLRVLDGDPHVGAELRRLLAPPPPEASKPGRTVGDLVAAATGLRTERERRESKAHAARAAARERSAAQARSRHLDALAAEGDAAWQRAENLIKATRPKEYDQAVSLLVDLRDLATREGHHLNASRRLQALRDSYHRRPALIERLDRAGLITSMSD